MQVCCGRMSESSTVGPLTLGIDLGTSAVKVVAVACDSQPVGDVALIGEAAAGFPTMSTVALQAEQEPADWLRAISEAMRSLDESVSRSLGPNWTQRVGAVGLTGQLPTLVCIPQQGPVARAITWKDGRADAWATARVDAARRRYLYARTGMPIDGRYLAPMLQFHFGDRRGELRRILSAKDYLLWALTGLELTEPSTAAGYGVYDLGEQRFSDDLCAFWQLPSALLPQIRSANSLAGPLTVAGAALLRLRAGVPVSTGAADSVCAAYAMAGLDQRVASISFGSSAVIIGASSELNLDHAARYLVTPHVMDHWFGREMDLLATGTGYRWLCELFGWTDGQIDVQATHSPPGARGLSFAPYLGGGEQGALWNPRLRGALMGLSLQHSRTDIARAYLEGVFFEIKRCIAVLAETSPVESVRVCGNIVASQSSLQMLADILQLPVGTILHKSPAAIGAALLARRIVIGANADVVHPLPTGQSLAVAQPHIMAQPAPIFIHPHEPTALQYSTLYRQYLVRATSCE